MHNRQEESRDKPGDEATVLVDRSEATAQNDNILLDRGIAPSRQLWIFGQQRQAGTFNIYAQTFSCAPLEGSAIPTKNGRRRMFNGT